MNKPDLIAALAAKEKLTEKLATNIINLIFEGTLEGTFQLLAFLLSPIQRHFCQ